MKWILKINSYPEELRYVRRSVITSQRKPSHKVTAFVKTIKACKIYFLQAFKLCAPSWARTKDPLINSQML